MAAGVQFDQNELAVKLGDIQLMQAGQPLAFDAKTASTYLKDTCAKHGTVNIYVTIGKGAGKGEWRATAAALGTLLRS
jgi:glutamate N-acetyltransferase/amino-acid N-acetyltransferase